MNLSRGGRIGRSALRTWRLRTVNQSAPGVLCTYIIIISTMRHTISRTQVYYLLAMRSEQSITSYCLKFIYSFYLNSTKRDRYVFVNAKRWEKLKRLKCLRDYGVDFVSYKAMGTIYISAVGQSIPSVLSLHVMSVETSLPYDTRLRTSLWWIFNVYRFVRESRFMALVWQKYIIM